MKLENNIADIPNDDDMNIIMHVLAVLQKHISEVYSPPTFTSLASEYSLTPGTSFDITVNDENGLPWDFDIPEQRERCKQRILKDKPWLLVGSPPCTAFSSLQNLNRQRLEDKKWRAMIEHGTRHLLFTLELYELQLQAGRYILHEHPLSATSWHLQEMQEFMSRWDLQRFSCHMCRVGMVGTPSESSGLVKKPTGFLTNAEYIQTRLNLHCVDGHGHIPLLDGRAKRAQQYPEQLCRAILMGLKEQLTADNIIKDENPLYHLMTLENDYNIDAYVDTYYDDMTGKI